MSELLGNVFVNGIHEFVERDLLIVVSIGEFEELLEEIIFFTQREEFRELLLADRPIFVLVDQVEVAPQLLLLDVLFEVVESGEELREVHSLVVVEVHFTEKGFQVQLQLGLFEDRLELVNVQLSVLVIVQA